MLIFASAYSLDKLAYCETWLVDGTFKSCPPPIYTIHEFFRVVRRNVPGEPACIVSDFELAAIKRLYKLLNNEREDWGDIRFNSVHSKASRTMYTSLSTIRFEGNILLTSVTKLTIALFLVVKG
ncbi:unnamed protein product [Allacma fusca]|uniref:Uncharacterized protein n=1 Tax=Allacma fusca TaxID=39272 RepID=A0A8J2L412_9HEXA|nr:unnamed protein product [Allacma fusca]